MLCIQNFIQQLASNLAHAKKLGATRFCILPIFTLFSISSTPSFADGLLCNARANLAKIELPNAREILVIDNLAFIHNGNAGLHIYNVTNPSQPVLLSTHNTPGTIRDIAVNGNTAYLVGYDFGLRVVDITNLSAPRFIGSYENIEFANDIKVVDATAFITADDLLTFDLSDPTEPTLLSTFPSTDHIDEVVISGDFAYLVDRTWLRILDVSNPESPTQIAEAPIAGSARDITLDGTIAYVLDYLNGILIFDVTNPNMPNLITTIKQSQLSDVAAHDLKLYITGDDAELTVYDTSDPTSPYKLGSYSIPANGNAIEISDTTAYVSVPFFGVYTIDINNTSAMQSPLISTFESAGTDRDFVLVENIGYIADGSLGLRIIDLTNPQSPTQLGWFNTPGYAYSIDVQNDRAYIADGDSGMHIYDVSNPTNAILLGTYTGITNATIVKIDGNTAFVIGNDRSMVSIDVSDPANPRRLFTFTAAGSGFLSDLIIDNGRAYIVNYNRQLIILDVSDPSDFDSLDYLNDNFATRVAVEGNLAYLSIGSHGMRIFDITDPTSPIEIVHYDPEFAINQIAVQESIVYSIDGSRIRVIDAQDPANPALLASHIKTDSQSNFEKQILVQHQTAYITDGPKGLALLDLTDCPPKPCTPDLIADGVLNFLDISAFLITYGNQDPIADFNADGSFNFLDVSEFLNAFAAGCP